MKGHRVAEWIQKQTHIYAIYSGLTSDLRHTQTEERGWKKKSKEKKKIPGDK